MESSHHSAWNFYLLGGLRAERDGHEIDLPPYRCRRLLVYLLLNRESPIRRERLLGDVYPDLPPKRARRHLSDHLWLIRSGLPGFQIESSGNEVQISSSRIWVDCEAFSEGVLKNEIEEILVAVRLYKGDLTPDLYDDWILLAREHFRNQYVNTLLTLAAQFDNMGEYLRSIELLERHLLEEPFDEAAVRQLMRAYVHLGRRGLAISTFEKYHLLWIEQLHVEPECETQILYESILARTALPKESMIDSYLSEDDPWHIVQGARAALNEGDRIRTLSLLREVSSIKDPELAFQRDLIYVDEAILLNDIPRAWSLLKAIEPGSGQVELRRAILLLAANDVEGAYKVLLSVLKMATNNNDRELEATVLTKISAVKTARAEFREAFLAIDRAIHLLSQVDQPALVANSHLQKGRIHYHQGANHDAREVLFQAQSLAARHNFRCLLAEINYWIGNSFNRSGLYLSAYKIFIRALETARDLGLKDLEAQILLGMSAACDFLGRYDECIQLLNSAREIYRKRKDPIGLAKVDYNLAAALPYHDESRCDEAIQYAQSALDYFKATGRMEWQAVAHTALAFALWIDGYYQEAIPHYQESIELHVALGEHNYIPELYAYIGLAYLDMGDLQAGLEWTDRACYEQSIRNHSDIVADIFYARGVALEASGEMQEAVKFYSRAYHTLLDYAQDIEDEEARQAYFHRDPVTRRLMKKINELGLSPQSRQMVIRRNILGRRQGQVEYSLVVDTGAADQAFAQGKGDTALRRIRLKRLLSQAERWKMNLTLGEIAQALNVSKRTVQRDLKTLKPQKTP